mmetsp:Transcript_3619/g.9131  ORF Transcript_3619/g.9131 Transcript_3619/m.9131 type:complete len:218 (-) Transcript_3619:7-660(-)
MVLTLSVVILCMQCGICRGLAARNDGALKEPRELNPLEDKDAVDMPDGRAIEDDPLMRGAFPRTFTFCTTRFRISAALISDIISAGSVSSFTSVMSIPGLTALAGCFRFHSNTSPKGTLSTQRPSASGCSSKPSRPFSVSILTWYSSSTFIMVLAASSPRLASTLLFDLALTGPSFSPSSERFAAFAPMLPRVLWNHIAVAVAPRRLEVGLHWTSIS